jgi:hypothetical protein
MIQIPKKINARYLRPEITPNASRKTAIIALWVRLVKNASIIIEKVVAKSNNPQ